MEQVSKAKRDQLHLSFPPQPNEHVSVASSRLYNDYQRQSAQLDMATKFLRYLKGGLTGSHLDRPVFSMKDPETMERLLRNLVDLPTHDGWFTVHKLGQELSAIRPGYTFYLVTVVDREFYHTPIQSHDPKFPGVWLWLYYEMDPETQPDERYQVPVPLEVMATFFEKEAPNPPHKGLFLVSARFVDFVLKNAGITKTAP